jgi:hypothetical protein
LEGDRPGWRLPLGATAEVGALVDREFLYSLAVEQANRSIRGAPLLPDAVE